MQFPIQEKFELTKSFLDNYKNIRPNWGFNGLGEFVYMRTYSRLKPDGKSERWYETVQRVVEGLYSIQKQHIKDYNLGWNQTKAQKSAQEMFERIFNFKMLPPGRSLWALGTSIVMERGLTEALYNCFSGDEKFLTRNGYKTFSEASQYEDILTLSGEWKKSEIKSFGEQKIVELHISRAGKKKIIKTTENHLWFANHEWNMKRGYEHKLLKTSELEKGMRLKYQFANSSNSVRIPSPQGIQHGFVFGDGTNNRIDLQKGKDESLLKFFGENRIKEKDGFYQVIDLPEHYKKFPLKEWDKKYMLGFLMGYFAADGSISNEQITISSSKIENLEFFKEMAETCGIGTYEIRLSSTTSNFKESRTLYQLTLIPSTLWEDFFILPRHQENFSKEKGICYWNVEDIIYTNNKEIVYCAIVPEKECFVLTDGILTHNCSFISTKNIIDNPGLPFANAMDFLMLGVGVGFDVQGAGKIEVKQPKDTVHDYLIPDTREGWVDSTMAIINSFFGGVNYKFDYSVIRPAGSLIRTFGGVSAGADPLIELHKGIVNTLTPLIGKPITSTAIANIINMIGKAVVSGNVRRSAEIILGNGDEEFLNLKNYKLNPERAEYGWASNNSVYCDVGMNYKEIAKSISRNGEPGLFWRENAQAYGRVRSTEKNWKDRRVEGLNP